MPSIYKELLVDAPNDFVWSALRDVASVHTKLARGFVVNTSLNGDTRTVTFANGFVVQEQIVTIDDDLQRLVYRATGGRATHHNASFQVIHVSDGACKVLWITDLLPDEVRAPIEQMVEAGSAAIKTTLEHDFAAKQ